MRTVPAIVATLGTTVVPTVVSAVAPTTVRAADPTSPPRFDGPFVGGAFAGTLTAARVTGLTTDGPFAGIHGTVRGGQMVLPWLGLGISVAGSYGLRSEDAELQQLGQGAFMAEATFVPLPHKLGLSLHAGLGLAAGAVRQAGVSGRSGFGGAGFSGAIRYTWFPRVDRYRRDRGGGFGLGPELGWLGATPAAPGRPMSNTIYLALTTTFYFGS